MPLYMDIHNVPGATPDDLAKAHAADMAIQHEHGVQCLKYWFNEGAGKVFCLIDAPSVDAANAVHREAHGLLAEKIIQVDPEVADCFLGETGMNSAGAALIPGAAGEQRDPGLRSVLFTDIVGSTELTQRLGDEAAMEIVDLHDEVVRDALREHGGREVKHTGDGIMAAFSSAVGAVKAGCQIQRSLAGRATEQLELRLRIGMAAGEPVEQRNDLFGSTVQLAARLCAHAQPGQVLVSNAIAELCLGKAIQFEDVGHVELKGFGSPVHVQAVRL
jgi:class 3 adenylate cyclase